MTDLDTNPQARPDGAMTTSEVAELTGVTSRRLDYWVRTGRVVPMHIGAGSGRYTWWSADDLALVQRIATHMDLGFNLDAAVLLAELATDDALLAIQARMAVRAQDAETRLSELRQSKKAPDV